MTEPLFIAWPDAGTMAGALAERIVSGLRAALAEAPMAGLVVSGGSTPKVLFDRLSGHELPWERVAITLADERLVAPDHPASNERLVRETLLRGPAARARFLSLSGTPDEVEARLADFPWPAAFTLLGMGNDGHTASLFPGSDRLADALDPRTECRVLPLVPGRLPADAPYSRMTLTLPALIDSRAILILLEGDAKKATWEKVRSPGPLADMPIRAVIASAGCPVEANWSPERT